MQSEDNICLFKHKALFPQSQPTSLEDTVKSVIQATTVSS